MAASEVSRKVLQRGDFGVCIAWPKTHWKHLGGPGERGTVLVDGRPLEVTVQGERCNCQGTGWHVHRFLSLPDSAGVTVGQRVLIGMPEGTPEPETHGLSVSAAIDELNDALLFGPALSPTRSERLGRFLAGRQGLPGSYAGLFAAVGEELAEGYRTFTGERMRSGGGARHILGEEALRALVLLERTGGTEAGVALMREALARGTEEMGRRLLKQLQPESTERPGFYCCHTCSVALWRALAVGAYEGRDDSLLGGLSGLRDRRTGDGAWHGFPFNYTVAALIDSELEPARAELTYARPALEQRLSRRSNADDVYATRRLAVFQRALELVG
jgi:hypothetical protein